MKGSTERAGLSAGDQVAAAEERLSQAQHLLNEARREHAELVQQRDAAAAAAASACVQVCCPVMRHYFHDSSPSSNSVLHTELFMLSLTACRPVQHTQCFAGAS